MTSPIFKGSTISQIIKTLDIYIIYVTTSVDMCIRYTICAKGKVLRAVHSHRADIEQRVHKCPLCTWSSSRAHKSGEWWRKMNAQFDATSNRLLLIVTLQKDVSTHAKQYLINSGPLQSQTLKTEGSIKVHLYIKFLSSASHSTNAILFIFALVQRHVLLILAPGYTCLTIRFSSCSTYAKTALQRKVANYERKNWGKAFYLSITISIIGNPSPNRLERHR